MRSWCSRRRRPCDRADGVSRPILAYPVGWAAGELPVQGIVTQLALLGLLAWWGWPSAAWLSLLVFVLAGSSVARERGAGLHRLLRATDRAPLHGRALPVAPLSIPHARDDVFGSWWRTAMQFPFHPRDMQLVKNVVYGPLARQRLDVWRTSTTPLHAPVVLYIHGGSWMMGDKREQGRPMLHEFVRRGWIAVVPNYRLAPRHPWPAQIHDVTRALGWVKKNVARLRWRPRAGRHRRWFGRRTAGGPGGAERPTIRRGGREDMADVTDWSVRGAMPFYGVLETTGDEAHWRGLGRGLMSLLEHRIVQVPFDGNEPLYRAMSPFERIGADAPPFFVVQGRNRHPRRRPGGARLRDEVPRRVASPRCTTWSCPSRSTPSTSRPVRARRRRRAPPSPSPSPCVTRPRLTPSLVKSYQVPPTELVVKVSSGEWVGRASSGARARPLHGADVGQPLQQ